MADDMTRAPDSMDPQMQKADPVARRHAMRVVVLVIVAAASGVVLVTVRQATVDDWLARASAALLRSPHRLPVYMAVAVLPLIAFACRLFVVSARIRRARRFPLPGEVVLRDTKIRLDRAALRHARVLQALAVMLLIVTLVLPVYLWYIIGKLTGQS